MSYLSPTYWLFMSTLSLGILMAVSSPSWFLTWVGLELNVMSFIPIILMKLKQTSTSAETALTYFLVQAAGSTILLAGALSTSISSDMSYLIIMTSLMLKMGAAPLHFWLPRLMQGMSWTLNLIMMTLQKIAPLALISYCMTPATSQTIMMFSIASAIAGSVGGINQTLLRKIMAFSSINHMAWLLSAMTMGTHIWPCYLLVYSLILFSLIPTFNTNQVFHLKDLSLVQTNPFSKTSMFIVLFSLGGLPPFLGFFPKLLVIRELTANGQFLWTAILLVSSLITLYYYMRMLTLTLTFPLPSAPTLMNTKFSNKLPALAAMNTIPALLPNLLFFQF